MKIKIKCGRCGKDVYLEKYERISCPHGCGNLIEGPDYSKQPKGCYITTACTEFAGLPDNCHELTMMRKLRDEYLAKTEPGRKEIAEYYSFAPAIVNCITSDPEREKILKGIHVRIQKISELINTGDFGAAGTEYIWMVNSLKENYNIKN